MPHDATREDAYAVYRETNFFGSLNGLRCLSILLVLWHHRPQLFDAAVELPQILHRGFAGVDFFFVLSGFLITTLLLREEESHGEFSIIGFYRRRALRIMPLYFLVVILCAFWWIGVRGQDEWWPLLPYYFLFLANFLNSDIPLLAPTWSLSVEEQYYLLWPTVLLFLPWVRWRASLLVALISVAVMSDQGILPTFEPFPPTDEATFIMPMGSYAAILIGSLAAIVLHHPTGFAISSVVFSSRVAPLFLFGLLLVSWQVLPEILSGWPNLVMHGLMAAIVMSLVVREDHLAAPVLTWRPIARVGEISYGVYLWHLVGLDLGYRFSRALGIEGNFIGWGALPIYLLLSYLIAEISYRYFETYFLRLKR